NLKKHVETIKQFGLPFVVAINRFKEDSEAEITALQQWCQANYIPVALTEVWAKGGEGGVELANTLLQVMEEGESDFHYLYDSTLPIAEKVKTIVRKVYGGKEDRKSTRLNSSHVSIS